MISANVSIQLPSIKKSAPHLIIHEAAAEAIPSLEIRNIKIVLVKFLNFI
tara:strand:- start:14461 stop:14610 length:150 start_codon:yes stop_codon:yes gene_type:complete